MECHFVPHPWFHPIYSIDASKLSPRLHSPPYCWTGSFSLLAAVKTSAPRRIELIQTIVCPPDSIHIQWRSTFISFYKTPGTPRWSSLEYEETDITYPHIVHKFLLRDYEEDTPFCQAQQHMCPNTSQTSGTIFGANSKCSKTQFQTRSILWPQWIAAPNRCLHDPWGIRPRFGRLPQLQTCHSLLSLVSLRSFPDLNASLILGKPCTRIILLTQSRAIRTFPLHDLSVSRRCCISDIRHLPPSSRLVVCWEYPADGEKNHEGYPNPLHCRKFYFDHSLFQCCKTPSMGRLGRGVLSFQKWKRTCLSPSR